MAVNVLFWSGEGKMDGCGGDDITLNGPLSVSNQGICCLEFGVRSRV